MDEYTIVKFIYEDNPVSFTNEENMMINATEMAKPFGKIPKDWLRTDASKNFINTLSAVRQICPTKLTIIKQGGNNLQGTWMHRDVALEFARWLETEVRKSHNGSLDAPWRLTSFE